MSQISITKLTPGGRPWRIDWFGEVSYPTVERRNQPSIRVAISPVLCDPNDSGALLLTNATDHYNQKLVWLPVGMLPLVKIGDIWQNGQCKFTPSYQTGVFNKLNIKPDTVDFIKAGLSIGDKFLLPLNEHPWHRLQTQSYCLSIMMTDLRRVIIPCIELIRFYFGSSSNFIHLLFTGVISEDMLWKSKSFDVSTGRLHLKIAENISGLSATDIGRIALDPIAWRAARRIFNSCQVPSINNEIIYPRAEFPFNGETDLIATGKWISSGESDNETFVVYSLKSCSHPFPFASLSYEVSDNKKISDRNALVTQGKNSKGSKPPGKEIIPKSQSLTDTDPGTSRSAKEHFLPKGSHQFPDLKQKSVWRERYDTNDPPETFIFKVSGPDEMVSVGNGSSRYGKTRSIDIGQGYIRNELSGIDPKHHKFVHDGIKVAVKQAKLQNENTDTELITLPGYTHPVISLPHLIDDVGEVHPVSFCLAEHGGQRLRRGCFVEIKQSTTGCYRVLIVEKENFENPIKAINVASFDLRLAMGKLIDERQLNFVHPKPPPSTKDF